MERRRQVRGLAVTVSGALDDPRSFAHAVETLRELLGVELPPVGLIEVTLSKLGAGRRRCEIRTTHERGTSLRVGSDGDTSRAAITSAAKLLSVHLRATSNAA